MKLQFPNEFQAKMAVVELRQKARKQNVEAFTKTYKENDSFVVEFYTQVNFKSSK